MIMDIWSDFNKCSSKDWEEKVLIDFKDKVIGDFYWKTEYGKINPFLIKNESILNEKSQEFNEIRWRFDDENKLNSQILNRLKDGVNSIYIDKINFSQSIFDNVMCSIIQNHVKLSPKTISSEIELWNNWGKKEIQGSLRMDPLENILENFSSSNLQDQFISYRNFNSIIKNKELKCLYINGEVYSKNFNDFSNEIAFLAAHFNEIVEYHLSNKIDLPRKVMIQIFLGNSFLESISKIKAIRCIINQIIRTHGLKMNLYIETSPNPEILNQKEFDFRLMSTTSTVLSSLLGGANSFEMSNSLLDSDEDYWKKIMINIPLILTEESQVKHDMSKGAHMIDQIAKKMAHTSWGIFKEIENKNGLIKLIDNKEHTNYYRSK
ncbi:MAG: hypothetical protein CL821_07570 [Crocinitomicaceae bacterium]|nr:hypothetical protein [Crocinitomicaceae bacterium]